MAKLSLVLFLICSTELSMITSAKATIFFDHKKGVFKPLQNNSLNLEPSYKVALDFWIVLMG